MRILLFENITMRPNIFFIVILVLIESADSFSKFCVHQRSRLANVIRSADEDIDWDAEFQKVKVKALKGEASFSIRSRQK